jgi:protein MpaA
MARASRLAAIAIAIAAVMTLISLAGDDSRSKEPPADATPSPAATSADRDRHDGRLEATLEQLRKPAGAAIAGRGRVTSPVRIGHSARGRPIELRAYGFPGGAHTVLAFGCIHGTECAGSEICIDHPFPCPLPGTEVFVVPNLSPDGLALRTRVNGRGVDLNRNFPSGWQPIQSRGDPQYSGPRPFSEPETRLAARLIRALRPDVTVWFHQQARALVRAWGPSVPAARRYARLVGLPFERLPWLAGTAPNWQNHRFRGASSFVVELAPGALPNEEVRRHALALAQMGRR